MKIKDMVSSGIFDENEQVAVLYTDLSHGVNNPFRPYTGRLSNVPEELQEKEIENLSAMGESRREKWNLNKYGWMEIWIDEE